MGHALDDLLDGWAAEDYGPDLAPLKQQMEEGTALLNRSVDHLREQEDRAVIDYYAVDLVDIATYVVNGWLTLQDARLTERKREIARVYITEALPKIRWKVSTLQALDPSIAEAREVVLAPEF